MPGFMIPFTPCNDSSSSPTIGASGPSNAVETARAYRYRLDVLSPIGENVNGLLLFLKSATRPAAEIDQIVIHNGQDEIYRPGKNRWGPVDLTFYEVISVDEKEAATIWAPGRIFAWWARKVINLEQSRIGDNWAVDAQLALLKGDGNIAWMYYMYQCWPIKVTPSDLSYTNTDISEITVTMRFSKAFEKVPE